jgi:methylmalonyl-CoA mutase N-terminal domain/subunit
MNNIVRVTIECMAGVLSGCQSLFPCSMDEAYCTPTENAVKLALRTQQIIAHETGIGDTIDPLGGSYYLETLTSSLEIEAKKYLDEIEKIGGVIKAIESGYFQEKIGESSYRLQKEIENRERIVVGVNEFVDEEKLPIEIFRPPADTAEKQKGKLRRLKEIRDNRKVEEILKEVERLAQTEENLVPVIIQAVKGYATLGEICDVFRRIFGEYHETKFY